MTRLSRIYTVLFHVSLWAVLILCIFLWAPRNAGPHPPVTTLQIICSGLTFVAIFYGHAYWLMPCLLFRKKILLYFVSVIAAWLIMAGLPVLIYFMIRSSGRQSISRTTEKADIRRTFFFVGERQPGRLPGKLQARKKA